MRIADERQFTTHDGTVLFYRYWPARENMTAARAIVLFHRGHEHSGRLQHVVDELGLCDFAMFAWDARGHGRSPGARGDSPSFAALVRDVDSFVRHVGTTYAITPDNIVVIGQSVGAVLAATWAHDYAPPIRGLVLAAPAFQVKLYVPFARPGLALLQRLFGNFFITSYVKARFLTQDAERIRSYDQDPLVTRAISARVLLGLYEAADRVVADASAIRLPLQLLISEKDWVVQRAPQESFFERLGSPLKERHLLADSSTTRWANATASWRSTRSAVSSSAFSVRRQRRTRCCRRITAATRVTRNVVSAGVAGLVAAPAELLADETGHAHARQALRRHQYRVDDRF
jgi:alpha-beta hydrolase superfamily lysophospholipase